MNWLFAPIDSFFSNREIVWQLTKREVMGRYRGSMMGLLWSFVTPILMLIIYTFFFSIIYKARWGLDSETKIDFAITLFAGLIPFSFFSECINRAPHLIINNVNYVKKVIFPLEIFAWINLGSALFHAAISTLVLLTFFFIKNHYLPWTIIFFPLVNLPLIFIILGLSWFLTSVGVFVRDVTHLVTLLTTSLLFLSPIFYSTNTIPDPYRIFINLNPLTSIIEQNRAILIFNQLPNWSSFSLSLVFSIVLSLIGYYWFKKTRHAFADVI